MEGFLNFFIDVLKFGLPYSVLALGIFISYRILDFADLGAEGSYTLGGAVVAICLYHSLNPFISTYKYCLWIFSRYNYWCITH